jgi:hypothetical protein
VFSLSPSLCELILRSASLGQDVVLVRGVIASANVSYSQSFAQNSVIEFKT